MDFTDHTVGSPVINRSSYFKQDFRLGYKLKLFCEASGSPRPAIVWYHRGVQVDPDHNRTIRNTMHGTTIASYLDIDPSSIGDKGEYECVATNGKGSRVKKFLTDYQY
uniref:Ig-like domain-containing protein n=2 Tax=Caenorhabditis japonica TaxID=281687 RepID=A0A8R1EC15_CAEJA